MIAIGTGRRELAGPDAVAAPCQNEVSIGVEFLDATVRCVGDIDEPKAVDRDAVRVVEVTGVEAVTIVSRTIATPDLGHIAIYREALNAMILAINDQDRTSLVDFHAERGIEATGISPESAPGFEILSGRRESLDAIVERIADKDASVGSDNNTPRSPKSALFLPCCPEKAAEAAIRGKPLDSWEGLIDCQDEAVARSGQVFCEGKLSVLQPRPADLDQEVAVKVELLQPVIAAVRDEDVVLVVGCHAHGSRKLAVA